MLIILHSWYRVNFRCKEEFAFFEFFLNQPSLNQINFQTSAVEVNNFCKQMLLGKYASVNTLSKSQRCPW